MQTSNRTADVLSALMRARAQFKPIVKSEVVDVTTKSGRKYTYRYAPLDAIQAATDPALSAEGLLLVSAVSPGADGTVEVVTRLLHATSEQWLESRIPWSAFEDLKALGGLVSYGRRYNVMALLDLAAEEDVDGSQATGDHVERRAKTQPSMSVSSNGHTPASEADTSLEHPTEAHIAALANLALTTCDEDKEVYYQRIRTTMGLKPQASVAPKLLTRTMSMQAYMTLFDYYRRLEAQLVKSKEAPHANVAETIEAPTTTAAPAGDTPAVPPEAGAVESSSAPEAAPADTVETLVQYAIGLGLKEDVTRRVIHLHKDLTRCRTVLTEAAERNRRAVA